MAKHKGSIISNHVTQNDARIIIEAMEKRGFIYF